jgi:hypothetical protein
VKGFFVYLSCYKDCNYIFQSLSFKIKIKLEIMKNQFKLTVLAFLATQFTDKYEQFNKAFELYRKTEGKNHALEVKLNRVGFTDEFLKALLYDLQRLNEITDLELVEQKNLHLAEKGVATIDVDFENVESGNAEDDKEDNTEVIAFKSDFELDDVEEEKSLREEFPFLNDENCPQIMYVVVGKRIASFKRYQEIHAKLQQVEAGELQLSEEDILKLIQDTEKTYAENRALWEELNHYATTGEILGKHELFRQNQLQKEVDEMSKDELVKFIPSSATFFSRKKTELAKAKDAEKIAKIQLAIDEREYKLKLVNEKLGVGK